MLDTIIVGSGPAGATLANELVKRGKKVTILEWGKHEPIQGTFTQMAKMAAIPGKGAFINSDLSLGHLYYCAASPPAAPAPLTLPPPSHPLLNILKNTALI